MSFVLDTRLAETSQSVLTVDIFDIRLVNDSRYLWLLVIPQIEDVKEIFDLPDNRQAALWHLAGQLSKSLDEMVGADKMNIATIGNLVPQFHLHIIARHTTDEAWPAPVWGRGEATPYGDDARHSLLNRLQARFAHLKI